jgi:hypothetical protein
MAICRGYARARIGAVVEHAWAVDEHGAVIETTWAKPGSEYFGVAFTQQ